MMRLRSREKDAKVIRADSMASGFYRELVVWLQNAKYSWDRLERWTIERSVNSNIRGRIDVQ